MPSSKTVKTCMSEGPLVRININKRESLPDSLTLMLKASTLPGLEKSIIIQEEESLVLTANNRSPSFTSSIRAINCFTGDRKVVGRSKKIMLNN